MEESAIDIALNSGYYQGHLELLPWVSLVVVLLGAIAWGWQQGQ